MHRAMIGLLLTAAAFGQDTTPNFTGQWKLIVGESENPPRSEVDAIEHKGTKVIITPHVGRADVIFSVEYRTDGVELKDKMRVGRTTNGHWEGATLILETRTPAEGGMHTYERYVMSLSDDGKVLRRDVYDAGRAPRQRLVFKKVCKYSGYFPPNAGEAGVRDVMCKPHRVEKQEDGTHLIYDEAEIVVKDGRVASICLCVPCR
jgi:hypothetical protein